MTFTKGQKVRSITGETFIVSEQVDCMVYVEGRRAHFHPSKLFLVK